MSSRRAGRWSPITIVVGVVMTLVASLTALVGGAPSAYAASPGRGGFVPITPFRLVDTRQSGGPAYGAPQFGTGETRTFNVYNAHNGQIPGGAVGSLALNVTAVTPSFGGFLTVWPSDQDRPTASVLNYAGGDVVPNAVTVKVAADGSFNVYAQTPTHVVIDVMGYFASTAGAPDGGGFQGIPPKRLMDTRSGLGAGRFGAGGSATLSVVGSGAAPASASAVVLNVTVTGTAGSGFLTVWPAGGSRPTVSNLNFAPGQTRANQVTVKVGSGGAVSLFALAATDVVVDIMGWYEGGAPTRGGFVALSPSRIMDTRINLGDANYDPATDTLILHITGANGVPASGVGAVSLNITAVAPVYASFLTVYPDGAPRPTSSNLNFVVDDIVPNAVTVGVGLEGGIELYSPAFLDAVADLGGYFTAA